MTDWQWSIMGNIVHKVMKYWKEFEKLLPGKALSPGMTFSLELVAFSPGAAAAHTETNYYNIIQPFTNIADLGMQAELTLS